MLGLGKKVEKKPLSVIAEEDLVSNFSDPDTYVLRRANKLSDSEWDSEEKGGSEKGFVMDQIQWKDLGRKYLIKRGRKSKLPALDDLSELCSARRSRSVDDRYSENREPKEYILSEEEKNERRQQPKRMDKERESQSTLREYTVQKMHYNQS